MKNSSAASLGGIIAELRKQAGMSQEDLAEAAALHRTYVSQLERGLKSPTISTLEKLAIALKTKASSIMKMVEDRS